MPSAKKLLIRMVSAITGNLYAQRLLEGNVHIAHYLMGIGSGSGVLTSGEESIIRLMQKRHPGPYSIFDVGANQGQFLNLARRTIFTENYSIHCFEPSQEAYRRLGQLVDNDRRVVLNHLALGKESGRATLHYDQPGSGLASLTKRNIDHLKIQFDQAEEVCVDTIDNYCRTKRIEKINLLKIDIEGHELDALIGAASMFASNAIDIVTFEFGGCNIDTRTFFRDFWSFFQKLNMYLYIITPSGYLHPIDSYQESCEQFRTSNFVACT